MHTTRTCLSELTGKKCFSQNIHHFYLPVFLLSAGQIVTWSKLNLYIPYEILNTSFEVLNSFYAFIDNLHKKKKYIYIYIYKCGGIVYLGMKCSVLW